MNFTNVKTSAAAELRDVFIFDQLPFCDERGSIWTAYHNNFMVDIAAVNSEFVHDKFVISKRGVLRGIHGDSKTWKLVTPIHGKIQQVVVDLRQDSATYNKHFSVVIDSMKEHRSILIPPGFGNAFLSLTDSIYYYKLAYQGEYYDAVDQFTVKWNDKKIGINWLNNSPILSERDA